MFLIIGELINSTRKRVGQAIKGRDAKPIRDLARRQAAAKAGAIDLNAGESITHEFEDLCWLIEVVEDELGPEARLVIDTSDPEVMARAIGKCSSSPIVNSISNEPTKQTLIEIAADYDCDVIGLAMGERGIPRTAEDRFREATTLLEKCVAAGIDPSNLYIDLICMSVASTPEQGGELLSAIRRVKSELGIKTLAAVSNVSFGLPNRQLLNRTFLSLLIDAGLDGAILDPTDAEIADTLCATSALLGADEYCMEYIQHYRASNQA